MTEALSLDDVLVIIGDIQIRTGWSDDSDAFMPPSSAPRYVSRTGATGQKAYFRNPEYRGGQITLKLLPNADAVFSIATRPRS